MQLSPHLDQFLAPVTPPLLAVPTTIYIPIRSERAGRAVLNPRIPRRIHIAFDIWEEHGPAFFSAIEEISNEVGGRAEGRHEYAREEAITQALVALGTLRAAVAAQVPHTSINYGGGR
jgi:hypothetical protein